jgi:hypothetical protein
MTKIVIQNVNSGGEICCKDPAALNYSYTECQNICFDNSCCVYKINMISNNQTNQVGDFNFNNDVVVGLFDAFAKQKKSNNN